NTSNLDEVSAIRVDQIRFSELRSILGEVIACGALAASWYFLNQWYQFWYAKSYFYAAVFYFFAVLILCRSVVSFLKTIPLFEKIVLLLFLFFLIPWGEWLRLNFPETRSDWSRQILLNTIFLSVGTLFAKAFPHIPHFFATLTRSLLNRLSTSKILN